MKSPSQFTLRGYETLVRALADAGYRFTDFHQTEFRSHRDAILRHDIDLEIDAALSVAQLEARLGVSSTFFVLVGSSLYNVLSHSVASKIQEIHRLGHKIGLHYETTRRKNLDATCQSIRFEASILEFITGDSVSVISAHKPGMSDPGLRSLQFGAFVNAYDSKFTQDIAYTSDSNGDWAHGFYLDSPEFLERRSVQILTHPIWWNNPEPTHPSTQIKDFLTRKSRDDYDSVRETVSAWDAWIRQQALSGRWT